MEERVIFAMIKVFFISFGVVTGGALFGSLSAYLTGEPPISELFLPPNGYAFGQSSLQSAGLSIPYRHLRKGYLKHRPLT